MTIIEDWAAKAAREYIRAWSGVPDEQCSGMVQDLAKIIRKYCPFKPDVAYVEANMTTLLQCVDCKNTESPAGAMARVFNHGRCMHCGGFFRVVRA